MQEITLTDVVEFDWDESNSSKSWVKHKVSVKEQEQAFFDKKNESLLIRSICKLRNDFYYLRRQRKEESSLLPLRNEEIKYAASQHGQ